MDSSTGMAAPGQGGPCAAGSSRVCGVTIEQSNGAMTCYRGHQFCEEGVWGACTDGAVTVEPLPEAALEHGKYRGLSLTAPISCGLPSGTGGSGSFTNPCDPACTYYDEDPDDITVTGSGGGTTTLPDWPGTPDIVACDHDLCSEGAGLFDGCTSCVSTVCATPGLEDCCDTADPNAWTGACVDAVYTECLGQPAPYELCDFAVFSEQTVTFAAGEIIGAPIGAANTLGAGTALHVATSGNGTVPSVVANGNVTLNMSQVTGTATYTGSITKQNGSTVGTENPVAALEMPSIPSKTLSCLTPSGSLNLNGGRVILSPGDARAVTIANSSAVVVLDGPGDYGSLRFNADGTVVFNGGGTYTFHSIQANGNGPTFLFPDGERVYVDICSDFTLQNNPVMRKYNYSDSCSGIPSWLSGGPYANGDTVQRSGTRYTCTVTSRCSDSSADASYAPGTGSQWANAWSSPGTCSQTWTNSNVAPDPLDLVWYTDDTNVTIGPGAVSSGAIIAPHGTVNISGANSSFYARGLIWAQNFTSNGNPVRIDATGYTGQACEDANLIPGASDPAGVCPIQNIAPGSPAALNPPCSTGLDCQINHRCVEPETLDLGGTCPHEKCMPGVAMTSACEDECVQRICDVSPSCCDTEWTQSCVDQVATVCDAECGEAQCTGDVCEAGPPIAASCDPCVADVCAVMPSCCTTSWTGSCVDKAYELCGTALPESPPTGTSVCDYAVYGGNAVQFEGINANRASVLGNSWIGGPTNASTALRYVDAHESKVTSTASMNLDFSDWNGRFVSTAGSVNANASTGSYSSVATSPPTVALPSRSIACSGANGSPASGSITPGNYGNVAVADLATLTLQPGSYSFQSLTLGETDADGDGAELALPASGNVTIEVCGKVLFSTASAMTGLTSDTSMQLDLYTEGGLEALGSNTLFGFLHSAGSGGGGVSAGDIWIGEDSTVTGLLIAEDRVDVRNGGVVIDPRGLAKDCRVRGFDAQGENSQSTPARLCAYGAYGTNGVTLLPGARLSGADVGTGTNASLQNGSRIGGSVYGQGNVDVPSGSATVEGAVQATGSKTGGGALQSFDSQTFAATGVPAPAFVSMPFSSCPGSASPGSTPAPGDYGWVDLWWGQEMEFQAGSYTFNKLDFHQSNRITLPETGIVNLHVCDLARFGEQSGGDGFRARVRTGPSSFRDMTPADALRFRVFSLRNSTGTSGSAAIHLDATAATPFAGTFIAPNGSISITSTQEVDGLAWGEAVYLGNNARLDATGIAGDACETEGLDVNPACPATLTPVPPPEGATCNPNAVSYQDDTCAGYDLAVDVPCGEEIPICNHGTVDFSGTVEVGYWAESAGQMSRETPNSSPEGTCSAAMSIAAGNCANLSCTVPDGSYSVMVDPNANLSECDDRRMDNWSVHDGRSCGASSSTLTVEYEYESICPDDTIGQWGFLTWSTNAPATSEIIFEAKTAKSSADLAAQSYTVVGIATNDANPTTNEECGFLGPAGCPVDLIEELDLSENQGQFLSLRITLDSKGHSAVLKDWWVTYTCVYDQ